MLVYDDGGTFQPILLEKLFDSLELPISEGTPRQVYGAVRFPGKATAITGMRRAGKSTFVHQLRCERMAEGADQILIPYINFEDERLGGLTADHLGPLVESYYRRYPEIRRTSTVTWSFDEIQVVPGWERFIRRMLDSEQVEIVVTGSSASLLSREIATSLRGRAWQVTLHPFSFREVLRHNGMEIPDSPTQVNAPRRSALEKSFVDYLEKGGFPEAQGLDTMTRNQLLRDYVDVAILRDVVERHNVSNVAGLRWLVRHLLGNAAGLFSVEKFYSALKSQGLNISKDTVHGLLGFLQDSYIVRTLWMEADSERKRMVNPRKAYPIDPGLIPLYDRTGRQNIGHALETVVLLELERRKNDVTWVRTPEGFEVDFLARRPTGEVELIQVCADASNPATADRELRALESASLLVPNATMRLLTLTGAGLPPSLPSGVRAEPAWVWLLREPDSEE